MPGKKKRIAYITQSFPLLTETFVYREVLGLRETGHSVHAFAIRKPASDRLSEESRHLMDDSTYFFPVQWFTFFTSHLFYFGTRPGKYLSTLWLVLTKSGKGIRNRILALVHFCMAASFARKMQRLKIRHNHAHFSINAATIALVIYRLTGIPFSFTAHNLLFREQVLLKEKVRKARFIASISEFTRKFLIDLYPDMEFADKIHIVRCGISPSDFNSSASKRENDIPVLLFVAQLAERKGAHVLVEACRILADRKVSFKCEIFGDGPERVRLETLVEKLDLSQFVTLPGAVLQENLKEHLTRADLFVLPCVKAPDGDMDGIPVSLMEAMAMELPVVSTHVSGIPELIEDRQSGLLVEEGNAETLADALQELIDDSALRSRLGKGGRDKIVEGFNIQKSVARIAELMMD